ncbi:MAG: hypothetical protein IKG81_11075 [Bacteroidales bacterium]|nr:hypothetical protein [Bacteroidales bacterium]
MPSAGRDRHQPVAGEAVVYRAVENLPFMVSCVRAPHQRGPQQVRLHRLQPRHHRTWCPKQRVQYREDVRCVNTPR